jgi:hypothetical protein
MHKCTLSAVSCACWIVGILIYDCVPCRNLSWTFDLEGIAELYASYEEASFWPFLSAPTQGIEVDFVRAENSNYTWPIGDLDRLTAYGHRVHLLQHAGPYIVPELPIFRMTRHQRTIFNCYICLFIYMRTMNARQPTEACLPAYTCSAPFTDKCLCLQFCVAQVTGCMLTTQRVWWR